LAALGWWCGWCLGGGLVGWRREDVGPRVRGWEGGLCCGTASAELLRVHRRSACAVRSSSATEGIFLDADCLDRKAACTGEFRAGLLSGLGFLEAGGREGGRRSLFRCRAARRLLLCVPCSLSFCSRWQSASPFGALLACAGQLAVTLVRREVWVGEGGALACQSSCSGLILRAVGRSRLPV
jgi:hypothetical protein